MLKKGDQAIENCCGLLGKDFSFLQSSKNWKKKLRKNGFTC
jgi:hypothetical protein